MSEYLAGGNVVEPPPLEWMFYTMTAVSGGNAQVFAYGELTFSAGVGEIPVEQADDIVIEVSSFDVDVLASEIIAEIE